MARSTTGKKFGLAGSFNAVLPDAEASEFLRGERDGRLGFSVSGSTDAYLAGYVQGRKVHYGLIDR